MNNLYNTFLLDYTPLSLNTIEKIPNDIISSETVFVHLLNAIKTKKPLSILRMGDGEVGFINYYLNNVRPGWLTKEWQYKFGLGHFSESELKNLGKNLITAAIECDFLGVSMWGETNYRSPWNIEKFIFGKRKGPKCSNWFNMEWMADGCAHTLVNQLSFAILHNDAITALNTIETNMGKDIRFITPKQKRKNGAFILNGNLEEAKKYIINSNYDCYLVSGGPASKPWMVEVSKKYNKVMVDLGHAITRCWTKYKRIV